MNSLLTYITPLASGFVIVMGALGLYLSTRAKNVETYATGWQGYAKTLEERLTAVEKSKNDLENKFEQLRTSFDKVGNDYLDLQREQRSLKADLESMKQENKRLVIDNDAKIGRITVLEAQVVDLQSQLDSYRHIDIKKVDDAKTELHHDVEVRLEDLKQ